MGVPFSSVIDTTVTKNSLYTLPSGLPKNLALKSETVNETLALEILL